MLGRTGPWASCCSQCRACPAPGSSSGWRDQRRRACRASLHRRRPVPRRISPGRPSRARVSRRVPAAAVPQHPWASRCWRASRRRSPVLGRKTALDLAQDRRFKLVADRHGAHAEQQTPIVEMEPSPAAGRESIGRKSGAIRLIGQFPYITVRNSSGNAAHAQRGSYQ